MFFYADRIAQWSNYLRADAEWTQALEAAFDAVGFNKAYSDNLPITRRNYSRIKAIKDHIWGMIELDPSDTWVLDCPLFQRMRHVRQTGFTYLTYPNAHHTRLEHSLGVYQVVKRLLASFRRTEEAFQTERRLRGDYEVSFTPRSYPRHDREDRLILHAALLHDLGHAVFSHVSEGTFLSNADTLTIGGKTVKQFQQSFKRFYELVENEIQTGRKKPLAELLSVAVITSSRFETFYSRQPGNPPQNAFVDLCDISALILGDRISSNDFALPEVLSGPVDADKIDYMIRDAHACGITIGIDVARVFVRAGVYDGAVADLKHLELTGYHDRYPLRIFVIEQSGTDAVQELGNARLSLYERVYNHQLTRNAQATFSDAIVAASKSTDTSVRHLADFLTLWQLPEDVVLSRLRLSGDTQVRSPASALLTRSFPKRAGCFGREYLFAPEAPVEVVRDALQDAHELRLQVFSESYLM